MNMKRADACEIFKAIEADFSDESTYDFHDNLVESLKGESQIVIMGAGRQGQYLYAALERLGIHDLIVWDNYVRDESGLGFPVTMPDETLDKHTLIMIAVAYSFDQMKLAEQFRDLGFGRIIEKGPLLARIISCELRSGQTEQPVMCPKCNYDYGSCSRYYRFLEDTGRLANREGLVLTKLSYNITTRCTLRCKHCGQKIFLFNKDTHIHVDTGTVLNDIDTVMKAIKYVGFFGLLGGEPLLHKELHIVIQRLLEYDSIGTIVVFTNGTIVPWKELIEVSKNNKVLFQVDDYGAPYARYEEQFAKVIDVLEQNSIPYFQTKTLTWFDYTETYKRCDTPETLKKKFSSCRFANDLALKQGYLFKCSNSFHEWAVGIKAAEEIEGDIFCFKGKTTEEIKEAFSHFLNIPYLKSCDYCAGCDYHNVVPAAIQLEEEMDK